MSLSKRQALMLAAVLILFMSMGLGAGYWLARPHGSENSPPAAMTENRKVLYWYDPMVPNQHFDQPGKSPFMDMPLVAKYADEGGDGTSVQVNPGVAQNLGLRLAKVERGVLAVPIDAVGSVQWNERQVAIVQTRSAGFVERVYARAAGDIISKGTPLADLLLPEWASAQTEFLALLNAAHTTDTTDTTLAQAARERLKLLGMPTELIARVEASRQTQPLITITAPLSGVIQTLEVRAGMSLAAGTTLAKINAVDPVWLEAAIPEVQASQVAVGNPVQAHLAAYPGQTLTGKVIAVLPEANAESRTLRVRVELPNREGRLKAGMYAQISLSDLADTPVLQVPSEAVIRTGTRNVVLLALEGGRFQPAEVKLGREAQGKVAVLEGLSEGQSIVASGQFLIDSEAGLKGVLARLASSAPDASALHEADGKVISISGQEMVVSHGPVPSLDWGAMTMSFQLARPELAATLQPGDQVHFGFRKNEESYVIEKLSKVRNAP